MRTVSILIPAALIVGVAAAASAADVRTPAGQVLLTIAGDLANTNRSACDKQDDAFFGYHEQTFDKAFAFDRAMLEDLGVTEVRIAYQDWREPITFSGPRLVDVLGAAGCSGGPFRTLALDGFSTEIPPDEVEARD